jgi:hypothetical protein
MTSELDAVNYLLDVLGSTPVDSLDTLHPDLASCQTKLKVSSKFLQSPGLWYNQDISIVLTPDVTTKEIAIAPNTLKVNAAPYNDFVIQRGLKLYDSVNNTYQFECPVTVDIIRLLDWDELPATVQDSIMFHAAKQVCDIDLEDEAKARTQNSLFKAVFGQVRAEDVQLKRRNLLNSPQASRVTSRYRNSRTVNPMRPGG